MSIANELAFIDKKSAKSMRSAMAYPRQRTIREENVKRLAREMVKERFIPGTQVYIGALPDGTKWILNGNHTLEAIALSGEPQLITITTKSCVDAGEAHMIYAVFDIHKIRTWHDSLRAAGKLDVIPLADKVSAAVGVIENQFNQHGSARGMASRPDRIELLESYQEAAELFAFARAESKSRDAPKLMIRASVLAVALETLRHNPSSAIELWEAAMRDDGLKVGHPAKALLNWLRNTKTTAGHIASSEHARAAALAWNAFFHDRSLQYVKPNAMGAFFLLGTPYAKGFGQKPTASKSPTNVLAQAVGK